MIIRNILMKQPNVKNILVDHEKNITYEVMAYCKLTKSETQSCVNKFWSKKKKPKIKPGETVKIITIIGLDEE